MSKCLVTKLKASTGNVELLKQGEMRINISSVINPTANSQRLFIRLSEPCTLEIVGDGYFTDSTLMTNIGKTIEVSNQNQNYFEKDVYFSNGNYNIAINNKYKLVQFDLYNVANVSDNHRSINLDDLKFSPLMEILRLYQKGCTGNIKSLENLLKIKTLAIEGSKDIHGDISVLGNKTLLNIIRLNDTSISGDISSLGSLVNLEYVSIFNSEITGDISFISNLNNLKELSLVKVPIYGDISNFRNVTFNPFILYTQISGNVASLIDSNIKEIKAEGTPLSGDLSKMPSNFHFIQNNNQFTWTERPSSSSIFGIEGFPMVSNIDKMLTDLAKCTVPSDLPSEIWYKTIQIRGTRTSASDEALATLQSKGYTISIQA